MNTLQKWAADLKATRAPDTYTAMHEEESYYPDLASVKRGEPWHEDCMRWRMYGMLFVAADTWNDGSFDDVGVRLMWAAR